MVYDVYHPICLAMLPQGGHIKDALRTKGFITYVIQRNQGISALFAGLCYRREKPIFALDVLQPLGYKEKYVLHSQASTRTTFIT